jgi:hypothetical protein
VDDEEYLVPLLDREAPGKVRRRLELIGTRGLDVDPEAARHQHDSQDHQPLAQQMAAHSILLLLDGERSGCAFIAGASRSIFLCHALA